jgi:enediyne biosynthesis protein E4
MRKLMALAALALAALGQGIPVRTYEPAKKAPPSGRPWPVQFTDVTVPAGLSAPFLSGEPLTKKYIVEANGAGVAFFDYNNDGYPDIFLLNSARFSKGPAATNHLYRNNKNGTFTDVTAAAGLTRSGWGNGICSGDVNNDGHEDLFLTYWGPNALYLNKNGVFTDITQPAGLTRPHKEWSSGCTFLDYDRDGHLDLFIAQYLDFDPAKTPLPGAASNCEWKGMPVFCGPRGLPHGRALLYRNQGDGTFQDVTTSSGIGAAKDFYAFTALAADLNGDGWTDLYVACDATPSLFFRNNKDGTFSEIGAEAGVAFNEHGQEQSGMGAAVGDFNNDGRLDLLKTNFANDYPNVYRNQGNGLFEDVVMRAGLAVNPQYVAWGIGLVDFDNDGWKDVFQVNGHLFPELGAATYRNPRLVYRNLGNGRFEDVSPTLRPASSRGAAFGDFDNDGRMDVLIQNMDEPPTLLRNAGAPLGNWLKVLPQGTKSNRSAIGATVRVNGQTEAVVSQSSYLSVNDRRLHFGLAAKQADTVTVRWPTGETELFGPFPANQTVTVVEGAGRRP